MLVDMKVLYVFNMCDRSFVLVGDDNVDGKDNEEEEIMEVVDIMIYHFGLLLLLAGVFLLLFHLTCI